MATTPSNNAFHIIHGWAEGNWHSKRLVGALKYAGYRQTTLQQADIIIAHSGGCYLLPKAHDNKTIILIGIPYWPGKSIMWALYQKVRSDILINRPLYSVTKAFWNIVYVFTKPLTSLRMWGAAHKANPLAHIPVTALIIRNQADTFCTPDISNYLKNKVVLLGGQHDDCWINPKPYVELIQTYHA